MIIKLGRIPSRAQKTGNLLISWFPKKYFWGNFNSMNDSFLPGQAILILDDGNVFYGTGFGKRGIASGEICFNTGMAGYLDVFSDPAYYGNIVIMNNAHEGNTNMGHSQIEAGEAKVRGIIGRNPSGDFSDLTSPEVMQSYFESQNIVGIYDIDTRALVIHLREKGVMNCIVSNDNSKVDDLRARLKNVPPMKGLELASQVSVDNPYTLGISNAPHKVAVLDLGIKKSVLSCLTDRRAYVTVFNAKTSYEEMESFNPDGYFISNGPGDPNSMGYAIETIKKILKNEKPIFGIGLGLQLLAIANDISVFKMANGHRGLNHPVKNIITDKSTITAQNTGFGIDMKSVQNNKNVTVTHINLNDHGIEGLSVNDKAAFGVQYYPECREGLRDSKYLFDKFFEYMK